MHQRGADRVLHADLRLAPGRDIRAIGAMGEQRIAAYHDARNLDFRMIATPVDDAIEHGVDHETARVRLVGGRHDLPALAPTIGDVGEVRILIQELLHAQ